MDGYVWVQRSKEIAVRKRNSGQEIYTHPSGIDGWIHMDGYVWGQRSKEIAAKKKEIEQRDSSRERSNEVAATRSARDSTK